MNFQKSTRTFQATWFALVLLATAPVLADHPNQPQGFDPERSYQISPQQIDQVDLFSGRLSLRVPVGPFTLFYNSNVWRYSNDDQGNIIAQPDRLTSAGLGWHLGWGEVYEPGHWYNPNDTRWLYVGDDGNRHYFYSTLHYDDGNSVANVFYTRDGSYLRMKLDPVNRCWTEIEFPDGSTRRFGRSSCGPQTSLRWTYAWDRFGSLADPELTITYSADDTLRTVTDRYGRVHRIHLTDQYSWMIRTITSIDVESVGGQRAVTQLNYQNINVDRSCKDDSSTTGPRIAVPHLEQVVFADGSTYSMVDGGALQYHNNCGAIDDVPGVLKGLVLPTGGKLRWDFQEYEFPPGGTNSVFNTAAGVATRRVLAADDTELGRWEYKTTQIGASGGNDPEMRTEVVVFPEGDCSRHFFNAIYWIDPNPVPKGWENSLPFTYTESAGGRYLSTQQWTGNDGLGGCDGTKLRSTYLRYRRDTLPGNTQNTDEWRNSNRQVDATRIVFHDDGNRWIDTEMGEYDGLGQFRKIVETGTLYGSSSNSERRETTIGLTRSTGIYPGTYTPLPPTEPWILGLYDSVEVLESEAEGETLTRYETEFDDTTGALLCTRQLTSGTTQSSTDLLTTLTLDGLGFVTDVKHYGGDNDPIGVGQSGPCGANVGSPVYWEHRTYQVGQLKSVRPKQPNGANGPFLTYDVDLDPSTGLVTTQRDSAGYATTIQYDLLGRVTRVIPQDGAETGVVYTPAVGTAPAKMATTAYAFGGGAALQRQEWVFDSLGRVQLERMRMPAGNWAELETLYNARGWMLSQSERGDRSTTTVYSGFDPFGRPATITPPEGPAHAVHLAYLGDRHTSRQMSVATGNNGVQSTVTISRTFDSHGRLRTVTEPSGNGGANTTTSYGYDVGSRLTRIASGPGFEHQFRTFGYDNRGFLLSESHPETGTVTYDEYDAQGLAHRRTDGARDLGMTYDFMGRPLTVFDRLQSQRLVKQFWYDGGIGFGNGKLWKATRHNYLELPWTSPGVDNVRITDEYSYAGIGGAVSLHDTVFSWPDTFERYRQWSYYDDQGQLSAQTYPRLVTGNGDSSATTSRSVSFGYGEGRLTSIPGWVDDIEYHPSGLWSRIEHANSVDHWQAHDPDRHNRTRRIHTTGASPSSDNYDSGNYSYDGSGNIWAMGKLQYRYDPVSRLVESSGQWGQGHQTFDYDRFGNLIERVTDGMVEDLSVDTNTNQLLAGTYDGAGNLIQLGTNRFFGYNTSNRVVSQAWMRYLYNASDERVAALPNVPQRTVVYTLRDQGNRRLSSFELSSGTISRQRDWVFAGQQLVASEDPAGTRYHYYADHLGTPRLIVDGGGSVAAHQCILPYGEDLCEAHVDNVKLGGHERDDSYDTDYMHARHYASEFGRFLSADPLRGRASSPQSLNRYSYVLGNPLRYFDPDGREEHDPKGTFSDNVFVWGWFFRGGSGGSGSSSSSGGDGSSPVSGETLAIDPIDLDDFDFDYEDWLEDVDEIEDDIEEEERRKEEECKFKIKGVAGVGGGAAAKLGVAGNADVDTSGVATFTGVGGVGAKVPAVYAFTGVKLGRGRVSGLGFGGVISVGAGWGFIAKFNVGRNGSWNIAIGRGFSTPHAGAVVGVTATGNIDVNTGEVVGGTECP